MAKLPAALTFEPVRHEFEEAVHGALYPDVVRMQLASLVAQAGKKPLLVLVMEYGAALPVRNEHPRIASIPIKLPALGRFAIFFGIGSVDHNLSYACRLAEPLW